MACDGMHLLLNRGILPPKRTSRAGLSRMGFEGDQTGCVAVHRRCGWPTLKLISLASVKDLNRVPVEVWDALLACRRSACTSSSPLVRPR